jgi:hypothetical protein
LRPSSKPVVTKLEVSTTFNISMVSEDHILRYTAFHHTHIFNINMLIF